MASVFSLADNRVINRQVNVRRRRLFARREGVFIKGLCLFGLLFRVDLRAFLLNRHVIKFGVVLADRRVIDCVVTQVGAMVTVGTLVSPHESAYGRL